MAQSNDAPNAPELRRALRQTRESLLAITHEITTQDPENFLWLADVGNFQRRVADIRLSFAKQEPAAGHLPAAEDLARASIATYDRLLARSPADADFAIDRLASMYTLGRVLEAKGDVVGAFIANCRYHTAAIDLHHRKLVAYPGTRRWHNELRLSYIRFSYHLRVSEDDAEWKAIVASPEAIAAVVAMAAAVAEPPPGVSDDVLNRAADTWRGAVRVLQMFEARGVLPPAGRDVLTKLRDALFRRTTIETGKEALKALFYRIQPP